MEGQTYIDNIDIYTQYGVWITKDGYNDLLLFPDLIEPEKNIWNEEDGIEVDLEHPILNAKEVIIPFAAGDPLPDTEEFIRFLSRPGYRILRIPSLGKEWELRLLAQTANKTYPGANLFSLRFADDSSPRVEIYEPAAGGGISLPGSPYSIDGQPFDKYGIVVESGRDSLLQMAAVKQNLTQQFSTIDGRMYDVGQLRFNSKEVTFKCCFITASMELFWQCYTAFFNDLIQPKERQLHYNSTGKSYPCYYKQTSGFRMLHNNGRVVAEFSLTLT